MANGAERRFNRVRGSNAAPVFRGKVVERHQRISIFDKTHHRAGKFVLIGCLESIESDLGFGEGRRQPNVLHIAFGVGLG